MAYTVKQVAALSGVSVRTLHFYDEVGLLKPAHIGANGYRFYEEQELLSLQQILFYRELGFELKQIKPILGGKDFEKLKALREHRKLLEKNLTRMGTLVETIDKTINHLKGTKKMKSEEMFAGFSLAAGEDRFGKDVRLGGEPIDCKVSGKDTGGGMCVFEFTGSGSGPHHLHHEQDEWVYILEGEFVFEVGERRFRAGPGESVFIPRQVAHIWAVVNEKPGVVLNTYQPAGQMEDFFREVGRYDRDGTPQIHEALSLEELCGLFQNHGMDLLGPPGAGEWKVDEAGRIVRLA